MDVGVGPQRAYTARLDDGVVQPARERAVGHNVRQHDGLAVWPLGVGVLEAGE